jgi:hypothetical protein
MIRQQTRLNEITLMTQGKSESPAAAAAVNIASDNRHSA